MMYDDATEQAQAIPAPSCRFYIFVKDDAHAVVDAKGRHAPEPCESYAAARALRDDLNCRVSA